jgi:hypothetical protein
MLEDALWAGVMDELSACDQPLVHRYLAPGAQDEAVAKNIFDAADADEKIVV